MGGLGVWVGLFMGVGIVSSRVMYNFGVGPRGDPLFTAFQKGNKVIYYFGARAEAETKAKRGPTPKLYITLLLYNMLEETGKIELINDIEEVPDLEEFDDRHKDKPKLIVFDDFPNLQKKDMKKINKYLITGRKFGFSV